jgi:hypothetical protein
VWTTTPSTVHNLGISPRSDSWNSRDIKWLSVVRDIGPWAAVGERISLVRMTSAGDEGEGVRAATIRTAPWPQALGNHRTRTRIVSMVWFVFGALSSHLKTLGHDQPRDSHVHGAPHARPEPSAQPMQYERGVCARRTATKYRNTTTATRHPAGLRAALACSVANIVAVAGSSG